MHISDKLVGMLFVFLLLVIVNQSLASDQVIKTNESLYQYSQNTSKRPKGFYRLVKGLDNNICEEVMSKLNEEVIVTSQSAYNRLLVQNSALIEWESLYGENKYDGNDAEIYEYTYKDESRSYGRKVIYVRALEWHGKPSQHIHWMYGSLSDDNLEPIELKSLIYEKRKIPGYINDYSLKVLFPEYSHPKESGYDIMYLTKSDINALMIFETDGKEHCNSQYDIMIRLLVEGGHWPGICHFRSVPKVICN